MKKNNKYLLIQEAKEKCRYKWNILIKHLENNESIIEEAKREIYEECGCRIEINSLLEIRDYEWITTIIKKIKR